MPLPDVDAIATYGGILANYAPVEDPTTDRDAAAEGSMLLSVAAATHTQPRAFARFVTNSTTPTLATLNPADGVWPNLVGNQPTPTRSALGTFLLTWPTTLLDEAGNSHTLNFRFATAWSESGGVYVPVQVLVTAANVVTVYVFTTAFALNDQAGTTLGVLVY